MPITKMSTLSTFAERSLNSVPFSINGKDYHPEHSFAVISPATGKLIHYCGSATVPDADFTVAAAAEAFKTWRKTTPACRRDILFKAAEAMERRREELIQYMAEETGATMVWCHFNLDAAIELIKDVAGRVATLEGSCPATMDPDTTGIVMREPYGVVLSIAPWNAPYILGTRAVVFPVAAGNTVVLKASELCPRTMWAIVSVFRDAGLPDGVINMIAHDRAAAASVTKALISNPLVKKINFTGSTAVGRIIGKIAGEHLKPVILELGGKAPAIVWEDADLELAADQCALGSFINAGQVCMCTERILIHKAIKNEFRQKFAASIEKLFPANEPAPILINGAAVVKNKRLITDAISKGASVIFGDVNSKEVCNTQMRPIVLDNVTPEMDIYSTESFGPLVCLLDIETEDEVIRIATDTEYGLTAAVFTEDLRRALRFAREIETGAVHVNSMTIHDESALPHGGAKSSGYGRFNSSIGLQEWVRTKCVTFKN